jgi:LmbE family N-acetylglucosaminyl deacetylase
VAPHPDDESIGCGGLLQLYGKQCDVVVITDGDNRKVVSDIANVREKEFVKAVTLAEVHEYKCLRIPEGHIKQHKEKIAEIDFTKYQHVFVPNRFDNHNDHVDVYTVVKSLVKKKTKLYEYEVWSPLRTPNIYLDITEISDKKIQMIKTHESQVRELDYVGMIMGLNAYRGRSHGYLYAECYYCEKESREQTIRRMKRRLRQIISTKRERKICMNMRKMG